MTTPMLTTAQVDQIMHLAQELSDCTADHALAIQEFACDRADYAAIPPLAVEFVAAENALRDYLTSLTTEGSSCSST